ncbi:pentapeptide repeat-containing protein [Phaeobacter sp. HF9A]|uniref:pentapeptide repeat-containing protein n=1 Tax=Phaeobacter sp. HF9A TaxID=2721561 RepID=UPI0014317260|nr:pentapeptide repeat-containing protein [Phaeobacter sp. HF9A]NIZ13706.1 pentapeptide repeat-containing protein [Phaeobacter sp. HF9A]
MANKQHIEWLKEGREAWNARRERDDFVPNFSKVSTAAFVRSDEDREIVLWPNIDCYGYNLRGANFAHSRLYHRVFSYCDLRQADLRYAHCDYSHFEGADLSQSLLDNASFAAAYLFDASFRGASLRGTILQTATLRGLDVRETDLRQSKYLNKNRYREMRGNAGTLLPERLPFPHDIWGDDPVTPSAGEALNAPLVRAASYDFDVNEHGVSAKLPEAHAVPRAAYSADGLNRAEALTTSAQFLAQKSGNALSEDARENLRAYTAHLVENDIPNPHTLNFLASGLKAELDDPYVVDGYSKSLKSQLQSFVEQHDAYLAECIPAAAEAIAIKESAELAREVTTEEAAAILDKLDRAISEAEAATDSYMAAVQGLREHDAVLERFELRALTPNDREKLARMVKHQTVERATFVERLYWRAKQVVETVRTVGGDVAIAATVSGKTLPQMAQTIVTELHPLMQWLQEILPGLPPV